MRPSQQFGRRVLRALAVLLLLICLGEFVARVVLGFGSPPLSMPHPTIEYLFRPDQSVSYRFKRHHYNHFGMRSEALPDLDKSLRVLVLGDSVLNGGWWTGQGELATTLATAEDPKRFYANISANSWGPANLLAYIRHFGVFDAGTAVLVVNTQDARDVPTFAPLHPNAHPVSRPASALWEAMQLYLPKVLPEMIRRALRPARAPHPFTIPEKQGAGTEDFEKLLALLGKSGLRVCIMLHPTAAELSNRNYLENHPFTEAADRFGVPLIDLADAYRASEFAPEQLYRDQIHLSHHGQMVLAEQLSVCRLSANLPQE